MSKETTFDDLKKQRRGAMLGCWAYFLGAGPALIGFTAFCGSVNNHQIINVFFMVLAGVVLYAVHRIKKVDEANARIKQHIRQHSFRLEDDYPPKLTELEF